MCGHALTCVPRGTPTCESRSLEHGPVPSSTNGIDQAWTRPGDE